MTLPGPLVAILSSRKFYLTVVSIVLTISAHFKWNLDPQVTQVIVASTLAILVASIAHEDAAEKGRPVTNVVTQTMPDVTLGTSMHAPRHAGSLGFPTNDGTGGLGNVELDEIDEQADEESLRHAAAREHLVVVDSEGKPLVAGAAYIATVVKPTDARRVAVAVGTSGVQGHSGSGGGGGGGAPPKRAG